MASPTEADSVHNPYRGLNSCEACRAKARQQDCYSCGQVGDPEEAELCHKTCSKKLCADSCSRVMKSSEPRDYKPKISCFSCKKRKGRECAPRCGNQNEPGFISCRTACAEKACQEICHPEFFK